MPRKIPSKLIATTTMRITTKQKDVDRLLKLAFMKPKEFVKPLGLPKWVYEKILEPKKMMEERE